MLNRVEHIKEGMGCKVKRLGEIVDFSIAESHRRTDNLMEHCEKAKLNSVYLNQQVELIKERVRSIE